ncbi:MAG: nitroreductase family protein, partial [Anaerolineaceae bacterium]|nr:nitroreductase family protein [Anaerolineaceae bacterium]
VAACPVDAIDHSDFPLAECPLLKRVDNGLELLTEFFQERRSIRVYKNKPIERTKVAALIEAARWAPSGSNLRAVAWRAVDSSALISQLSKNTARVLLKNAKELRDSVSTKTSTYTQKLALMQAKTYEHLSRRMKRGEKPIFFGAPAVLFAITPRSHFGRDDAVIAGYTMQLAAVQMGLATCQIGYFIAALAFDPKVGKNILNVPDTHKVEMVITLGYPKYKMRRSVPRKPLSLTWIEG